MEDKILKILKDEPGLTAKEISKKIGVTRKKVNQFFAFESTLFIKDDNYCWHIKDADKLSLIFPSKTWVTPEIFEDCLSVSGCLHSSPINNIYFDSRRVPNIA